MLLVSSYKGQKLYLAAQGSLNAPIASQNLITNTSVGINKVQKSTIRGSLGSGYGGSFLFGYKIKTRTALELVLSYNQSPQFAGEYVKDTTFKEHVLLSSRILRMATLVNLEISQSVFVKF